MMRWFVGGVFFATFSVIALPAEEAAPTVEEQIQLLNKRIADLEAQAGGKEVAPPKAAEEPAKPVVAKASEKEKEKEPVKTIYDRGYYFLGHNDTMSIGGFAQTDYRQFIGKHGGVDQFLIRRARLDIQGTLEKVWAYRLLLEFGGTTGGRLQHAWLEYKKWPWLRIRAGQFKEPFSLETLTSSSLLRFIERAMGPTNLAPFEDIGVQVFGTLGCEKWVYAVAVYNGQGINKSDLNDSKDIAARVTYQPFRYTCNSIFQGLYLGSAFTTGYNLFDLDGKQYVTGLRTAFQTFGEDVAQRGNLRRAGLEFEWIYGPYWAAGEYIYHRRKNVYNTIHSQTVRCDSWYIAAACLLTGEYQPRNAPVKPCRDFDPCSCGKWGAWEVNARYNEFHTNHRPFSKHLIEGTDLVRESTVGVVWWPNDVHVKIQGNFIYDDFGDTIVVSGHKLRNEKGVVFRAQYVF